MCVIVYKPIGKKLPSKDILEKCFDHNSDGAGYMLPLNNKVLIHKGFMNFDEFKNDIEKTIVDNNIDIKSTPIVLHFRISTQGGKQTGLCHPYPVCRDYENMRQLENVCDMALCHNGIISSCSTHDYYGGHWDKQLKKWVRSKTSIVDYNDTMTFIKDYASLVIDNDPYFAQNNAKCELLERLCEYSKLAIMNSKGYVKLIGQFIEKKGIYYSNLNHETEIKYFSKKDKSSNDDFKCSTDYFGNTKYSHYIPDDSDDPYLPERYEWQYWSKQAEVHKIKRSGVR